jgi:hypothetical protein
MKALHDGSTLLKGVMDIFLRDPLIDWEREELCTRKKVFIITLRRKDSPRLRQTRIGQSNGNLTPGMLGQTQIPPVLEQHARRVGRL